MQISLIIILIAPGYFCGDNAEYVLLGSLVVTIHKNLNDIG